MAAWPAALAPPPAWGPHLQELWPVQPSQAPQPQRGAAGRQVVRGAREERRLVGMQHQRHLGVCLQQQGQRAHVVCVPVRHCGRGRKGSPCGEGRVAMGAAALGPAAEPGPPAVQVPAPAGAVSLRAIAASRSPAGMTACSAASRCVACAWRELSRQPASVSTQLLPCRSRPTATGSAGGTPGTRYHHCVSLQRSRTGGAPLVRKAARQRLGITSHQSDPVVLGGKDS
jgi:hypothetical protein